MQRQRHESFIMTLAHELRQPLGIMFNTISILRDAQSSTAVDRVVKVIDRQAHQMSRLVEDLIDSAHWAQGRPLLRTERVDVRAVVADAAEAVFASSHQIFLSDTPEPLWVDADPARLRQVLSNLLDNAIKFTEPGGKIELAVFRAGREIVVRVRDNGRGLRPHELEHIFELFSQVRPDEGRGLGIGLYVASQIVALHKGRIEARSDGPSRGSEFIVTLPSATVDD